MDAQTVGRKTQCLRHLLLAMEAQKRYEQQALASIKHYMNSDVTEARSAEAATSRT